jgi:hypothetical protein
MSRNSSLSLSPDGRVYHDGFLMGVTESLHSAWGDELWGYRVAGVNMTTFYVPGSQRDAAVACATAFHARRRHLADLRTRSRHDRTG